MSDLIKVLVFSDQQIEALNSDLLSRFSIDIKPCDNFVNKALSENKPNVILTFGVLEDHPSLADQPLWIRKKWIHIDDFTVTPEQIVSLIEGCFASLFHDTREFTEPLVSIITPTFNTKNIFWPYRSVAGQEYKNIEWIIYDDGSDSEDTINSIKQIASVDPRIKVFFAEHSGSIGEVKHNAFMLAEGEILVELDHDDELTPWCVSSIVEAFTKFPDAGFAYTDCAEVIGDEHENASYPDGWGFGYGSYRSEFWRGRDYLVSNYPDINSKTIRHIVGVPNHARAWKADFYKSIGGHNRNLFVADDYELLVRTWLSTAMVHIQRFGYIQYHHENNTQKKRNAEIQNLVALIHQSYEENIHQRFLELGILDFIWNDGMLDWSIVNPEENLAANYIMQ
jgi:glycosyltransferase involved in cell wall biosynthesis